MSSGKDDSPWEQKVTRARDMAVQLFSESLERDDRLLVTGTTGWFGRTLLRLVPESHKQSLMLIKGTGPQRSVSVDGHEYTLATWNPSDIRDFQPTLVFNFGYLTREKWATGSDREYVQTNMALTDRLLWLAELPSTRLTITVSSGAAVAQRGDVNPYGQLKAREESLFLGTRSGPGQRLVLRAWSVSGGLVQNAESYLFSSLLTQAPTGLVRLYSSHPVWRRYSLVDDALAVALSLGSTGQGGVLDTGGPLIEARKLASTIAERFNCGVQMPSHQQGQPDLYYCDGLSWRSACDALDYRAANIDEQITLSAIDLVEP